MVLCRQGSPLHNGSWVIPLISDQSMNCLAKRSKFPAGRQESVPESTIITPTLNDIILNKGIIPLQHYNPVILISQCTRHYMHTQLC